MNSENHSSPLSSTPGLLEEALLSAPYPIVVFEGLELRVIYINDALLEIWGKDRSVLGHTFIEILPELEDQPFPGLLRQVIQTGEPHQDREAHAYFLKDGIPQVKFFDYSYTPIRDKSGAVSGVLVICQDVTEQVLAKQKVRASEEKFRESVLQAPFAMALVQGPDFIIDTANQRSLEIWGRTKEVIGKRVIDVFPELVEQGFIGLLENVYQTGEAFYGNEVPVQLIKNGEPSLAFLNFVYHPLLENNEVTAIMSLGYDVTDQVLSRKRVEESELKFRNIVLQAPVAMAILQGADFIIEAANQKSLDMWKKGSDVVGKPLIEVFPEYVEQGVFDLLTNVFNTGEAFHGKEVPFALVNEAGTRTVYSNFVYQPIFEQGRVSSIVALGYDVTDLVTSRKQAEERGDLLQYLNKAGEELALALDTESALNKIAQLIVPKFADWFTINVLKGENLEILMVVNEDQEYVKWAKEYRLLHPITVHDASPQGNILRTGESLLVSRVTPEMLDRTMDDKVHAEMIKKMNLKSSIVVPMKIGNKITGTINFLSTVEGREYNEADLSFAKDFATRIALTLENARLHEQQQAALAANERLLNDMEFERNRFEAVVTQMPGSVVIGEAPSGKLIFANEKINEVWGHPLKESENIEDYIDWIGFHPDGRRYEGHEWPLARSIQHGEVVNDEDVDIIRGDGKPAILRLSSSPIRDSSGSIIAGVVISQDVTELKRAIRARDEFLSIASHELKTPLTTLTASIQMLMKAYEKDVASPAIPTLIKTSNSSAGKLSSLIRELLNVSRIESGHLKLDKTRFNLAAMVQECCQHVRLEGTHELVIEGDLALEVVADQRRIDQVVVNFVNNAVKYAPESPKIRLRIEQVEQEVRLSVIDEGIGIPEEKIPHLFERYYRVDPSGMQYSGLGLGLYISSEIVKLHGGRIGVISNVGEGSTFWFTIPVA